MTTTKHLVTMGQRLMRIAAEADIASADILTAKARLDNAQAALSAIGREQTELLLELRALGGSAS